MKNACTALALALVTACSGADKDPAETGAADPTAPTDPTPPTGETDTDSTPGDTEDTSSDSDALYGPDNDWWHANAADVPGDLAGTGYNPGDIAYNMTFVDLNGDTVELYQFYGKVILLDLFAQWCGPCQDDAPELEECWQELQDDDVILLSIMHESNTGAPAEGDLQDWASAYGITFPIVADPFGAETGAMINGGFPTYPVIDRDMTIVEKDLFPFNCGALGGI